ncbi:MAG: L-lactate dehydrogenase [Anaerolineales bacterium]
MKIGIVGSGFVGATAAYALIMRGIGREIVLVDLNAARAQAEADDLFHAVPFANALDVRAGEYADLAGCRVIILTAGVNQQPGETRLQLLERNAQVFRSVVPGVLQHAPEAVLLVATNPVDVMTHVTAHYAAQFGVPGQRIIGSGTTLDTARFRALLGRHLGVDPQHIHAYVLGEHGDSEVLAWSAVAVGGIPLAEFCRETGVVVAEGDRRRIDDSVRRAAYHIIAGKKATYYGIGSALARIVQAVLGDQRAILSVCTRLDEIEGVRDVTLSVPHLVGGPGIIGALSVPLDAGERARLKASATVIREALTALNLQR